MSDMASQYFNTWKEVFDSGNTKYLWCAWHVDRAWRKVIKKYFKSSDEQRKVYHQLRVLMMQTIKTSFQILLTKFLTSHVNSPPFVESFKVTAIILSSELYVLELALLLTLICIQSLFKVYSKFVI